MADKPDRIKRYILTLILAGVVLSLISTVISVTLLVMGLNNPGQVKLLKELGGRLEDLGENNDSDRQIQYSTVQYSTDRGESVDSNWEMTDN